MRTLQHPRTLAFLTALAMLPVAHAQNTLGKSDDQARIALNAYVPDGTVPDAAANNLRNKLGQIATANGLGGGANNQRFIITANVVELTKDPVPSTPPKVALTLEVTVYVGDGVVGTKFSSASRTVKGVGENEAKAYIDALRNIPAKDPGIMQAVEDGKARIIEYYNSQCDIIINRAKGLAGQEKFDEALSELMAVPEVCAECHEFAMEAAGSVYKAKLDRDCRIGMARARAEMANENYREAALELSNGIPPGAPCYDEASKLMADIGKKAEARNKRDWNFAMKVWDDSVDIKKQEVAAWRAVGVAYGQNQPAHAYNVRGWW